MKNQQQYFKHVRPTMHMHWNILFKKKYHDCTEEIILIWLGNHIITWNTQHAIIIVYDTFVILIWSQQHTKIDDFCPGQTNTEEVILMNDINMIASFLMPQTLLPGSRSTE